MKRSSGDAYNFDLFYDNPESKKRSEPVVVSELPDIDNLYRMFAIYNNQYFDGCLPQVKISYSGRMMVAGAYYPGKKEIRLSLKYHQIFPDEVYDTLKHEMIHILNIRHDAQFRKMADRIGASVRANEHPTLRRQPRYIYICPVCLTEYPRHKRLRMASCGKCSKNGFDARYKLILKKKPTKTVES